MPPTTRSAAKRRRRDDAAAAFASVPSEVLLLSFAFASRSDLPSLVRVSTSWHQLLMRSDESNKLWRELVLVHHPVLMGVARIFRDLACMAAERRRHQWMMASGVAAGAGAVESGGGGLSGVQSITATTTTMPSRDSRPKRAVSPDLSSCSFSASPPASAKTTTTTANTTTTTAAPVTPPPKQATATTDRAHHRNHQHQYYRPFRNDTSLLVRPPEVDRLWRRLFLRREFMIRTFRRDSANVDWGNVSSPPQRQRGSGVSSPYPRPQQIGGTGGGNFVPLPISRYNFAVILWDRDGRARCARSIRTWTATSPVDGDGEGRNMFFRIRGDGVGTDGGSWVMAMEMHARVLCGCCGHRSTAVLYSGRRDVEGGGNEENQCSGNYWERPLSSSDSKTVVGAQFCPYGGRQLPKFEGASYFPGSDLPYIIPTLMASSEIGGGGEGEDYDPDEATLVLRAVWREGTTVVTTTDPDVTVPSRSSRSRRRRSHPTPRHREHCMTPREFLTFLHKGLRHMDGIVSGAGLTMPTPSSLLRANPLPPSPPLPLCDGGDSGYGTGGRTCTPRPLSSYSFIVDFYLNTPERRYPTGSRFFPSVSAFNGGGGNGEGNAQQQQQNGTPLSSSSCFLEFEFPTAPFEVILPELIRGGNVRDPTNYLTVHAICRRTGRHAKLYEGSLYSETDLYFVFREFGLFEKFAASTYFAGMAGGGDGGSGTRSRVASTSSRGGGRGVNGEGTGVGGGNANVDAEGGGRGQPLQLPFTGAAVTRHVVPVRLRIVMFWKTGRNPALFNRDECLTFLEKGLVYR